MGGHDDQMDVVRHEAVAQDLHLVPERVRSQQIEVKEAILVLKEDVLAVVAPLGDVVRDARRNHASLSWHTRVWQAQ